MYDQQGDRGRMIFSATGASADGEDLTLLGEALTLVGTRRVGTMDERNELESIYLFSGLQWHCTTDGFTYTYSSGGWVRQALHTGGTFFGSVAADGTTQIQHGLPVSPTDVQISAQSHPTIDVNSRYFDPVVFGGFTDSRFNVRLLDRRTNEWAGAAQAVRFQWHAFSAAQ